MSEDHRTETWIHLSAALAGLGAWRMAPGGIGVVAALSCVLFGGALVAFRRAPDPSRASVVLLAAGFVRLLLGEIGILALLLVVVLAPSVGRDHARSLTGAAAGVHLSVAAAHQLATWLGEPFPSVAPTSPGQVLVGLGAFLPFMVVARAPRG